MDMHEQVLPGSQSPILILAVDDEPSVLRILKDILETNDMMLIAATSAEEAYEKLKQHSPSLKLILLDVMLPDENGLNICRYIKTHRSTRNIPVIILSVKASERDKINGLEMGADDYIAKPFSSGELKARIKSVLRSYKERRIH